MNPYLITSVLFLFLAGLIALDSALINFTLLPWFNGLRWLRVHLITLGALTEALFGILPVLAAQRAGKRKPGREWNIWLALTAGLLILMVGIPLVNFTLILTGGTLVFTSALMLMWSLRRMDPECSKSGKQARAGRAFYLAGLSFLLLGIVLGTGLWFGWGQALRIVNTLEVHIHTNTWGFMSLVLAGLAVDLYPRWTGRQLAWPSSTRYIFWMMTSGALGAVLGPWIGVNWIMAAGIVLQQAGTVWLLANMIKPVWGTAAAAKPGIWHIITSYAWQLVIVLGAPVVYFLMPDLPTANVEQYAPQVLIYSWMLQYGYALIPYLLARAANHKEAELGGSWFSLAAVHTGGVFLAASILAPGQNSSLLGLAYFLWFVSLAPIVRQSWQILSSTPEQEAELVTS